MKSKGTKKAFMTVGLLCCLFLAQPAAVFSWNQATHAYIAQQLGARAGLDNLDEMWGSVAPDMFNYVFDPALCPGWIADQTQGTYAETFLKVWNAAETTSEEALAYGFVSHNQQWGADFVAHVSGLRPGYENDGYIITKVRMLLNTPYPADPQKTFGDLFAGLGMSPYEGEMVAHLITEEAVDIRLGSEVDPLLGRKVAVAARGETKRFQPLLVKAFAADYADYCFGGDDSRAAAVLTATEKAHRKDMIFLGQAISQPEPVAVQLLAEQIAGILPEFLGGPLPVSDAEAVETMKAALITSMTLCDDYKAEVEAAIEFVGKNLKDHGISYDPKNGGKRK